MVNLRSRVIPDKPAEGNVEVGASRRRRASSVQPESAKISDRKPDEQGDGDAPRRRRASSAIADSPRPRTRRYSGLPDEEDAPSTPRSLRKSLRSNTPDISKTVKSNLFEEQSEEVPRPAPIQEEDESPTRRGVRKSKDSDFGERKLISKGTKPPAILKNKEMESPTGDSGKPRRSSISKERRGSLGKAKETKITDYFDSGKRSPVLCLEDVYASNLVAAESGSTKRLTPPIQERKRSPAKGMTRKIMELFISDLEDKTSGSPSKSSKKSPLERGDSSPRRKSKKSESDLIPVSSSEQGKMDEIYPQQSYTKSPSHSFSKSESRNKITKTSSDNSPTLRSPRKSSKSESDLVTVSSADKGKNGEVSPTRRQKSQSTDEKLSKRLSRKSESSSGDTNTVGDSTPSRSTSKNNSPAVKSLRKSSTQGSDTPDYAGNKLPPTRQKEKNPSPLKTSSPSRSVPKESASVRSPRKSAKSGAGRTSISSDNADEKAEGSSPVSRQAKSQSLEVSSKRLSRKSESSNEGIKTIGESSAPRSTEGTPTSTRSPRKRSKSGSEPVNSDQEGKTEELSLQKQRSAKRNSKSEGIIVPEVDTTKEESRTESMSPSFGGVSQKDLTPSNKKGARLSIDKGRSERDSLTLISIEDTAGGIPNSPQNQADVSLPAGDKTSSIGELSGWKVSDVDMPHDSSMIDPSCRDGDESGKLSEVTQASELSFSELRDTGSGQKRKSLQLKGRKLSLEITEQTVNSKAGGSFLSSKNDGDTPVKTSEPSPNKLGSKLISEPVLSDKEMAMDWEPTKTPEIKNDRNASCSDESSNKTPKISKRRKSGSERSLTSSEFQVSDSHADIGSPLVQTKNSPSPGKPIMLEVSEMDLYKSKGVSAFKKKVRGKRKSKRPNDSGSKQLSTSPERQVRTNEMNSSQVVIKDDVSPRNDVGMDAEKESAIPKTKSDDVKQEVPSKKNKKRKKRKKSGSDQQPTLGGSVSNVEATENTSRVMPKDVTLSEGKVGTDIIMLDDAGEKKSPNVRRMKKKKRTKSGTGNLILEKPKAKSEAAASNDEDGPSASGENQEDTSMDVTLSEGKVGTDIIMLDDAGDKKSPNVRRMQKKKRTKSGTGNHILEKPKADSEAAASKDGDGLSSSGEKTEENGLGEEETINTSENKAPAPVEESRFKDNTWKMGDSEVTVRRRGGGTIIGSRPVFSDDAKYVYVNCGWGVRVFSIETGECVKVFDAFSKEHKVVACFCWKSCPAALTSEGVFIAWDPRNGRVLQKMRLNVRELVVDGFFFSVGSEIILCLVLETKRSTWLQIYSGTTFRSQAQHPLNHRKIKHPYKLHHLSVGCKPERPLIAFISKRGTCKIINIENQIIGGSILSGRGKTWTCVQCHPTEDTVALGDSIGRIVVYRIGRAKDWKMQLLPSVYHWHTLPVREVAFTSAGSSMYSGGGELTLVKWNLENPHMKNYLPRLSADIVHITVSPYNQMIAIATLDNGIQIVSPNNKLHCVLQQLSWSVFAGEQEGMFPAGLIYDPRSRGLMLNGRPGHLQLYSPLSETITYNIDVTMMNYLTQERDKVIVNTQVTHSALTSDGLWLATIETRYEPGLALELKLKFWEFNVDKKRYVLATVIDMPHDGKVHTIKFSPGSTGPESNDDVGAAHEVVLASTGADKKLRLWSKTPIDSIYQKGSTWRCQNACFYRDRSSGPCSFSYDGSLLAVGFDSVLTLWDVENVVLKQTITRGTDELKFVEFGRDDCCHIVMCAYKSNIVAWNLLTLSLVWKVDTRTTLFVPDPYSCFFAIFTAQNQWKILDAHNGEVAYTMNSDGKSEVGSKSSSKSQVLAAVFVPRHRPNTDAPQWMRNSYLYYIDIYQELNCLEPANEISQLPIFQLAFDKDAGTPFGSLVGAKSVREAADEEHTKQAVGYGVLGSQAVTQLLRPPAHTLPPVSLLCGSFLQSFVIMKRDALHAETDHEDKSEDDKTTVVASSDSEGETRKRKSKKTSGFKKPAKPLGAPKTMPRACLSSTIEVTRCSHLVWMDTCYKCFVVPSFSSSLFVSQDSTVHQVFLFAFLFNIQDYSTVGDIQDGRK
ncbi:hypothetical protein GE061_015795 [Apolygus lucorum]|uniref:WD repeat-containing protein 75 second beta-propeller domain-containing protein n=1 Tax=Apolygus lucorum TaxID=248454 RepID=A0A8S9XLZ3_APOLU|nr:hypothetical protein GE061_015795 [Apolygus lucorum]